MKTLDSRLHGNDKKVLFQVHQSCPICHAIIRNRDAESSSALQFKPLLPVTLNLIQGLINIAFDVLAADYGLVSLFDSRTT